jgi:hypothetical protein
VDEHGALLARILDCEGAELSLGGLYNSSAA